MILLNRAQINKSDFLYSTTALLILLIITKLLITLFAIVVYAKFSPFRDAELYLNTSFVDWKLRLLLYRTFFTGYFYAGLKQLFIFNTAVHLFISTMTAFVIWYILKSEYKYINKPLLWACLLLPHFLIWTGVVGKEALAITGFLLVIKVCVDVVVCNKIKILPLLIGFFLGLLERPHYGLAYLYLFLISLLVSQNKIKLMSLFSPWRSAGLLLCMFLYCGVIFYYLQPISTDALLKFMLGAQSFFLPFMGATNRWNINWQQASDFFANLYWGIPISIIGPTSSEVVSRPILTPIVIEGLFSLTLMIVLCFMLIRSIKSYPKYSTLIIWGFIPALLMGLLINYPMGIFNTGSAIRYKQSLTPLLYFYPLLLMGAMHRKRHMERSEASCEVVMAPA